MKRQAAVFVTVEAAAVVAGFRAQFHPRSVARLLPPHITIIPPFVLDADARDALSADLAAHFAAVPAFAAELTRIGRFTRHVWLAPEPHEAFVGMIAAARDRFPDLFRGEETQPVPHLTIAEVGKGESLGRVVAAAEAELEPHLPFRFDVTAVSLWESRQEGWHEVRSFELG